MLYTVGRRDFYNRGLDEHGEAWRKRGRDDKYVGGIVFERAEDAERYLILTHSVMYSVYGLVTDLSNTYLPEGTPSPYGERYLVEGCQIVRLD